MFRYSFWQVNLVAWRELSSLYNLLMQHAKAPEFDPRNPLGSALEVIRAVLFDPVEFYKNFSAEGSVREPALFAALVSVVSGVLLAVVITLWGLLTDGVEPGAVALALVWGPILALISPVAAAAYLLTIRVFVGAPATFGEVYRMLAYAYATVALAWIPLVGAFAVAYALMFLMLLGIRAVYQPPLITATIATLTAFVPVTSGIIFLVVTLTGMFF